MLRLLSRLLPRRPRAVPMSCALKIIADPEIYHDPAFQADLLSKIGNYMNAMGRPTSLVIDQTSDLDPGVLAGLAARSDADFAFGHAIVFLSEASGRKAVDLICWSRSKAVIPVLFTSDEKTCVVNGARCEFTHRAIIDEDGTCHLISLMAD